MLLPVMPPHDRTAVVVLLMSLELSCTRSHWFSFSSDCSRRSMSFTLILLEMRDFFAARRLRNARAVRRSAFNSSAPCFLDTPASISPSSRLISDRSSSSRNSACFINLQ